MTKEIIDGLMQGNARYMKEGDQELFSCFRKGQSPSVTAVMCSDSRVAMGVLSDDPENKVFAIENIGNQITTAQGSVDYGVLHLKTPVLVVLGHTQCGAVIAGLGDYTDETDGIRRELDSLSHGLSTMEGKPAEDDELKVDKYAQHNVDHQVKLACGAYAERIEAGELTVIGMMMDFCNTYGEADCQAYITNVNGDTDVPALRKMDLVKEHTDFIKRI